ncbi:hypothetical protein C8A00DRAFT_41733 [Chaetomidium leptoderma]|uniref:Alpha/beta-hydrolase n=1 Tax=Chaetomidium leptoderma TaxID=669021 RepID=A0AAN6VQI8_9PEZI|nr:hypothetical protein C8A00DRAFT_41733 [Chaetomidium leptoderma]
MSRWLCWTRAWGVARPRKLQSRFLSTHSSIEHVRVPCASSGGITVSLHNISKQNATTPLMIIIPPFSQPGPDPITPLPSCFQDYPAAVINYRWQAQDGDDRGDEFPLHWPTPIHDVSFGYSWIMDNLGSGRDISTDPRPAYVYGSYLGASLAAGLALTESHAPVRSRPMTIRGLIALNGIYNWTMFLPDHPIHKIKAKPSSKRKKGPLRNPFLLDYDDPVPVEEEGIFTSLKHQAPGLFSGPSNLFDPFASACLFFHSANLHVPDDFTTPLSSSSSPLSAEFTAAIDALEAAGGSLCNQTQPADTEPADTESAEELLSRATTLAKQQKPPRKGYLVFPPRHHSTLRLPSTLFLYDRPNKTGRGRGGASSNKPNNKIKNSFQTQASDLASLMMRSLDMHELPRPKQAAPWEWEGEEGLDSNSGFNPNGVARGDEDDARMREIERRVQSFEVDPSSSSSSSSLGGGEGEEQGGLGGEAGEVVGEWLRERIDEDFGEERDVLV